MELVTKCDQYLVAFVGICSIFLCDFMTSQHSMMAPGSQATPADEATLRAECHQAGANDSSCVMSGQTRASLVRLASPDRTDPRSYLQSKRKIKAYSTSLKRLEIGFWHILVQMVEDENL